MRIARLTNLWPFSGRVVAIKICKCCPAAGEQSPCCLKFLLLLRWFPRAGAGNPVWQKIKRDEAHEMRGATRVLRQSIFNTCRLRTIFDFASKHETDRSLINIHEIRPVIADLKFKNKSSSDHLVPCFQFRILSFVAARSDSDFYLH